MSELRQVLRGLRKQPLHTGAAMLAFGLAIAANTAIFSVADALVFHPIALPEIERLVLIHGGPEGTKIGDIRMAPADYFDLRAHSRTFESVAASRFASVNLTGIGEPERLQAFDVTPNFLDVIGVKPFVGANFDPKGERAEVILSYDYWERRFASSRAVIGTTVHLNGKPHTIIAVAPPTLRYPITAEVWRSLTITPQAHANRGDFIWAIVARIRPGTTLDEATAEAKLFGRALARDFPDSHSRRGATLFPFREMVSGAFTAEFVRMMLWSMTLLIAIACANVANLQVARITARAREFSLRQALGGSRWRIAGNVLLESLLLGAGGLALGALIAVWFIDLTRSSMPAEVETFLPGWRHMSLNRLVFLYASGISLVSSVAAGLWPAWRAGGLDLAEALKEGGRAIGGNERSRFRHALVVVQVALSLTLLVGGLLIVKGTGSLAADVTRFDAGHTLTARLNFPLDKYPEPRQREQFVTRAIETLRQSPRVAEVSLMTNIPYSSDWWTTPLEVEGFAGRKSERPSVYIERADENLLHVLRVPMRQGRNFLASDTAATQPVALVNQTLASRFFPSQNPIGRRFRMDDQAEWVTIVGVSQDYLHDWVLRGPVPTIYRPYRQSPVSAVTLMVRPQAGLAATELAPELRKAVSSLDAQQPIYSVRTFERAIRTQLVGLWYLAGNLGVAGFLSLVLSATGLFSLLSFIVTERTREVGVRMALGAQPAAVLRLMLGQGLRMVVAGLLLGLVGSYFLGRVLAGMVLGVSPADPEVLIVGSLLLMCISTLACYLPARRAAQVDPMISLRQE